MSLLHATWLFPPEGAGGRLLLWADTWRVAEPIAPSGEGEGTAGEAKARSRANSVMPIEPSGTRPSSTRRAESFSHSSEPTPMPKVNVASSRVTAVSLPPRTFLV